MSAVLKRASRLPFAPIVAALFALAAAALVMAAPGWLLERGVNQIGLSSFIPAAAPPLGMKARLLLALMALFGTGVLTFIVALPLARALSGSTRRRGFEVPAFKDEKPAAAAAEAGAARQQPIFADRELGAPFMSDEALVEAPFAAAAVTAEPVFSSPYAAEPVHAENLDVHFGGASFAQPHVAPDQTAYEEEPLMLDASLLADGLPFGPSAPPAEEEPVLVLTPPEAEAPQFASPEVFVPYVEPVAAREDDFAHDFSDVPGLVPEEAVEDVVPAFDVPVFEVPRAPNIAQPVEAAFPPVAAAIPVAPPVEEHRDTIVDLVERLEKGLTQLSAANATARQHASGSPIALQDALGRLERLAAANR